MTPWPVSDETALRPRFKNNICPHRLRPARMGALALKAVNALVLLGLFCTSKPADAATATNTFAVTATVVATCTVSGTTLAFGNYTGVVNNATSTLTITCTNTTTYNVGLNAGTATGATVTTRSMTSGATLLNYSLYSDSARTTNWGNSAGTWVAGTGNGGAQTVTIYGQIPASQYPAPNSYSDTITVTVNY